MKRVKILVGLLFLATATVGCSDFLSEVPDNRTQIDTPKKVAELLVGAYPNSSFAEFAEQMSDNVVDSGRLHFSSLQHEQNFQWLAGTEEEQDSQKAFWMDSYKAIASANTALQALETMEKEYANKPSQYGLKQLRAEALIARAYNHFMLVNLWAKSYDPATAETDLGVPYVTSVETQLKQKYKRNSVAEVYKFIEEDLLEGLKEIKGATYASPDIAKYHFTEASAKAFATRFYLYKGDYVKAIEFSNSLGDLPVGKLRDVNGSRKWDDAQNNREFAKTDKVTNLLVANAESLKGRNPHITRFVLTTPYASRNNGLFTPNAHPLGIAWNYPSATYQNNDVYYVPKFYEHFKVKDFTNMTGNPYVVFVLFSNDMLYLDRMEAYVMENRIDEALKMYNYLVLSRSLIKPEFKPEELLDVIEYADVAALFPYVPGKYTPIKQINEKQAVMLEAVADMRRREGFEEGYRWFDIRRFGLEVTHEMVNGPTLVLKKGDLRYQLQIPQEALNDGITANPR